MSQLSTLQQFWAALLILAVTGWVLMNSAAMWGYAQGQLDQTDERKRPLLFWGLMALMALWFGAAAAAALVNWISLELVMFSAIIPIAAALWLTFARPIARRLKQIPTHWLVFLQVYRVAGAVFIFPYMTSGLVTREFGQIAGWGDVLTGLLALVAGLALLRRWSASATLFIVWNIVGIGDLLLAMGIAGVFGLQTGPGNLFPLTTIPLFLGPPFSIMLHGLTLRNYALRAADNRPAKVRRSPKLTHP